MDSTFNRSHNAGRNTGRMGILAAIVGIHVLLVVAINTSLSTVILDRLPPLIKAEIIEEIVKDEEPPPPPPTVETPPPYVPPPDIVIDLPTSTKGPTISCLPVRCRPTACRRRRATCPVAVRPGGTCWSRSCSTSPAC